MPTVNNVEVEFVGAFRELAGSRTLSLSFKDGTRLIDVLRNLGERFGKEFNDKLMDSQGKLNETAGIIYNGKIMDSDSNLATKVSDGDKIVLTVTPILGG